MIKQYRKSVMRGTPTCCMESDKTTQQLIITLKRGDFYTRKKKDNEHGKPPKKLEDVD